MLNWLCQYLGANMSRSDLLISAVKSGLKGDRATLQKVVKAIVAEERSKQHTVIAKKLEDLLETSNRENPQINGNGNGRYLNTNSNNLVNEFIPQRQFSDLVLPEKVRKICDKLIEEQHRKDLLRSYNLEPRNRVMLVGPPGNGKTSLSEAIAEALSLPLLVVRYESVVGKFLGDTGSRLKQLFDYVSTRRCVLFFDEFETLGKERGDDHESGEIKRVVSSLLLQIDDLPSHVLVIGATNHPELLDRAVWRRFQIRMNLPKPTQKQIIQWITKFEDRIGVSLGISPKTLVSKVKFSNFAELEEFGTSVYREFVLNQPNTNLKKIVLTNIEDWSEMTYSIQ